MLDAFSYPDREDVHDGVPAFQAVHPMGALDFGWKGAAEWTGS